MSIRGNWEKRCVGPLKSLGEIDRGTFVKLSGLSVAAFVFGTGLYTEEALD